MTSAPAAKISSAWSGVDADARGVLAVYDGEVGRVLLLDRAQQAAQGGKAGLGDDVADR